MWVSSSEHSSLWHVKSSGKTAFQEVPELNIEEEKNV